MLEQLFGTAPHILWWQETLRAFLIMAVGLVLVRIAGRRVFGKWSALDIIVSIIIGSNLSRALTGNAPLWGTLAASSVLLALHWLLAHAAARSERLSQLLEGASVKLKNGPDLHQRSLGGHSVSVADVCEALHQAGLRSIEEADAIFLEPSGKLIAMRRS